MKLIVGLGNPGKKYEMTRHNVGFMVADGLAAKLAGETWTRNKKFNANMIKTPDIILAKPETFMNNSGDTVERVLAFYKLLPKNIVLMKKKDSDLRDVLTVVHDDLDLPLGTFRVSDDSGSAGNKGVQSVINKLKTKNFKRYRIGIASGNRNNTPTVKFVLERFSQDELITIKRVIKDVTEAIAGENDI